MKFTLTLSGRMEEAVLALALRRGVSEQEAVRVLLGDALEFRGWSLPDSPGFLLNVERKGRSVAGFVYLFAHLEEPLFKIGYSTSPLRRLEEVAKAEDAPLELVCSIPTSDMRALERALHEQYSLQRVRGEWFHLSPEDIAHVAGLAKVES